MRVMSRSTAQPHLRGRIDPKREEVRTVRARPGRRVGRINELEPEIVAQHLERDELADEVRAQRSVATEVAEYVANVAELLERVPRVRNGLQLAPEANEDRKARERRGLVGRIVKDEKDLVRIAGLAVREALLLNAIVQRPRVELDAPRAQSSRNSQ